MRGVKRTRSPTPPPPTPPPLTFYEQEYLDYLRDQDKASKIPATSGPTDKASWRPRQVGFDEEGRGPRSRPSGEHARYDDDEEVPHASGTKKNKRKRKRKNKTKGNKRRKRTSSSNKKPEKKKDTRKRKASMNARGNKSTPPPRSPPSSPARKRMTRREILKNPILPKLSRKYKPKKGKFGYM